MTDKAPTSFPGFSPTCSVGRVGENPGNEVDKAPVYVRIQDGDGENSAARRKLRMK